VLFASKLVGKAIVRDYRGPDRIGRRYLQLHSVREGAVAVTIEDIETPVDVVVEPLAFEVRRS